jgi:hypothetical protein
MPKVIYPITWLAGREGEAADVLHDIALEMMEHRADLLRHATKIPKTDSRVYRKQARLFEEYATVLDAIYFQLEPERWDPDMSGEMLDLAHLHQIALPDWMLPDRMKLSHTPLNEPMEETIEHAVNRFENEGGHNVRSTEIDNPIPSGGMKNDG